MQLPEDLIKIRDELASFWGTHKGQGKDLFREGFDAAAEIFLKQREAETKQEAGALVAEAIDMDGKINKLQANNESIRQYGLEQFRLAQKLQARNEKLVEALKASCRCLGSIDEVKCSACQALSANAQAPQNAVGDNG